MKKIALLIFFVILCGQAHAGQIQFSTIYPAPYGIYDRLRLVPRPALGEPCDPGSFYVNEATDLIAFCDASGHWGPLGTGFWSRTGHSLYPTAYATDLIGIGTTTPSEFELRLTIVNDGGIIAKGTFGGGDSLATTGAGTRLIWYPRRAAFRAGGVDGNQWDDTVLNPNIGNYSFATGYNTLAKGNYSVALGNNSSATADNAIAIGSNAHAYQTSAVAIGGYNATASGLNSTSIGGVSAWAEGDYSTALGYGTTAHAFASMAVGRNTDRSGNSSSWVGTDPLFAVGNGSDDYLFPANAFTVLKNGTVGIGTAAPNLRLTLDKGVGPCVLPADPCPDGGILAIGTFGSGATVGTAGDLSAGTYLIWYPRKAAFRAGGTDNLVWDDTVANPNIGNYSVGIGLNPWAKGIASVAMGHNAIAKGDYSVAMGDGANTLTGGGGTGAVALGYQTTAAEASSTALGDSTEARGTYSLAINNRTKVDRTHDARDLDGSSTQIGGAAMGYQTTATSYFSTVIGRYNVIPSSHQNTWSAADPIFVIGNGNGIVGDPKEFSNAWTVKKNGDTTISGVTTASGGLIINTVTSHPGSPANGQIILCTDINNGIACDGIP